MRDLTDRLILYVSLFLSFVSFILNCLGAKYGLPRFRSLFAVAALFSFLFLGAYVTLVFFEIDVVLWTSITRGFALASWVFVWCAPPALSILLWREMHSAVEHRRHRETDSTRVGDLDL